MLITLAFSDVIKEYDIDVKQFPTIADYVESCGETTMTIPEYFNSSSMDWLIDMLKNNVIDEYSTDYWNNVNFVKSSKFSDGNFNIYNKYNEYIDVNYLDMIFAEYMGINLFEITISNGNKQITIDLDNINSSSNLNNIKIFNNKHVLIYNNDIYVYYYKCNCNKIKVSGIAINKIPKIDLCVGKACDLYALPYGKHKCDMNKIFKNHYTKEHIIKHKCKCRCNNVYCYCTSKYYYYTSRINIVWENVDWTVIEKFYNNKSIRPSLSLSTVVINEYDDDITTTAKINIINKLTEEELHRSPLSLS